MPRKRDLTAEKLAAEVRLLKIREQAERAECVPAAWAREVVEQRLAGIAARLLAVADAFKGELRAELRGLIADALGIVADPVTTPKPSAKRRKRGPR